MTDVRKKIASYGLRKNLVKHALNYFCVFVNKLHHLNYNEMTALQNHNSLLLLIITFDYKFIVHPTTAYIRDSKVK
jgi:hypothetical protein